MTKSATAIEKQFIAEARKYLSSTYLPKIQGCLETLNDEDIWWCANEESNSIGNLLLHLSGSTRMWIVSVVGNTPSERNRQQEFAERKQISITELMDQLRQTVEESDRVLEHLDLTSLPEHRQSPWGEVTVFEAVLHAVEHFAMHTGQIITLTKIRTGKDLKLSV